MRKILSFILTVLALSACSQASDIPFEEVRNYFLRNDAVIPSSPMIDSSEQFESLFGAAAFMGKDGQPTPVDFGKEFIIAVIPPVTDTLTRLDPESLRTAGKELVLTYRETVGETQSWTMQPLLLVKVDRKYLKDSVRLEKKLSQAAQGRTGL